jgi:hypothetical protein
VDNVAPAVAITAPAAGAMVSGSVTITANASDSSGIAGVQFLLDGAPLGAEDTTAPYSAVWNTAAAADGSHTLAAIARDAAGKTMTSASVSVSVDNVAPAVAITAPAAGATVSGSVTITASASDSSGIAGVQFLLDGAPLGAEDTTAPYSIAWDTTTASSGPHAVSAVARDGAGRSATASPHTVSVSNVSESTVRIEDTSSSIAYAGSWSLGNTVRPWSGGTAALATGGPTATGQQTRATLTFTGIAVRWIGYQSPQTGIARVYLDGTLVATIDTYSSVEVVGAVLYEVSGLANMQHTLAIEATGTKNAAASDIFVVVDAFDVTTTSEPPAEPPPGPPATRVEDTDPTIVYTPGSVASAPPNWWHGSRSRGWSGETSSFNRSEGARATFAFTGTSVTWIGFRAPWAGIGRVYVDGALVQEVDLYSPTEQPQAAVFTAAGLAPGSHTIVVESTAGRNPSATDNAVVVDAFDVGPAAPPRVAGERIEHGAAAVAYTGTWTSASGGSWSGGGAVESFAPGAQARVAFAGTTVSLVGLRGPRNGIARIYLDGAFHATVDTYAATEIQSVIFTDTNLAPGWHELVVEVSGLKHAAATDYRIVVDAFDVAVRFEEVDPAVVYTGSWSAQNFDEAWSGTSPNYGSGSATRSATAGARAEFTFVGTAVRWIGYRGPVAGIARVFVDGALAGEVDAYASIKQVRAELFSAAGLSPGSHTIAIEVTGSRNPSASNAVIVVDAFDVTLPAGLPVVTRFQQTAAAYPVGPWEQSSPNPLYTGATVAFTTTAGARADFSFTGSGVRWIGHRAFANRFARVYLDGVHVADVNTIAPVQEEFQAVLFGVTGLTDGPHTLSIVMLDPQEPAAATNRIIVDAFDVIR